MRLLLDTQPFIWLRLAPERLGREISQLEDRGNDLLVSAVTAWEIAIKHALGKLDLPDSPDRYVPRAVREIGARPLAIEHDHALAVAQLPPVHRDPFDRLLVAQAIALDATIVTADRKVAAYPAQTIVV